MRYVSNWNHGDGASDAINQVDDEIDATYLYGHGLTPEPSRTHSTEDRGKVRDSFISAHERVVHQEPPYSGTWNCRACSEPFGFGQLSAEGYCYDDQVFHLTAQARHAPSRDTDDRIFWPDNTQTSL